MEKAKTKRRKDFSDEEWQRLSQSERNTILENELKHKIIKYSCIGILILFLLVTIFNSLKSIPTGYVGVKTRFGKVQTTIMSEGMNFKVPYIEKIVLIDCRTQKIEYTMEASSKDLQKISNLKISVNYNVSKEMANKLYSEVGVDYKSIILEPAIYESIKSTVANYTAEELITKRAEISALATEELFNRVYDKGIHISSFNITDLSFSAEFDQAIEQKQITEQQTQQAKYELEKAKVENEKKIENAKAEAEVMKQQNAEITDNTLELKRLEIQEKLIEKWNGQLPTTTLNDSISSIFNVK